MNPSSTTSTSVSRPTSGVWTRRPRRSKRRSGSWLENPAPPRVADPGVAEGAGHRGRRGPARGVRQEAPRADRASRSRRSLDRHRRNLSVRPLRNASRGHPGGRRGGGGSAVQVAAERRYREHRRDLVLDTRQLSLALKKLRALNGSARPTSSISTATIDRTAREGGELELVFATAAGRIVWACFSPWTSAAPCGRSKAWSIFCSRSPTAAGTSSTSTTSTFTTASTKASTRTPGSTGRSRSRDLFRRFDRETRLVLVGDAHMYPGEITDRYGAINWMERNEQSGAAYLSTRRATTSDTARG